MSVRFNSVNDILTVSTAPTVGTNNLNMGLWVKVISSLSAFCNVFSFETSTKSFGPCIIAANEFDGLIGTSTFSAAGYAYTTGVWYYVVQSRSGGNLARLRVFDDSTSTTPLLNITETHSDDYASILTLLLGSSAGEAPDAEVICAKLHTVVNEWTDAECRTESQNLDLVATGGTNRYVWELEDIDADIHGINEASGGGPNFTNTGCVNGASRPSQLEAAGGGGGPALDENPIWTPKQEWRAGKAGAQQLAIPRFRGEFGQ